MHGICTCTQHFSGDKCDQCKEGYGEYPNCHQCTKSYYGYPNCKACSCFANGSKNTTCNVETGVCECNENFAGDKCDICAQGFFGFPTCKGKL